MGHVHGWMVGSATRAKESQKAQQSVASTMEGIYNIGFVSVCLPVTKLSGNVPRNTPDDQDVF